MYKTLVCVWRPSPSVAPCACDSIIDQTVCRIFMKFGAGVVHKKLPFGPKIGAVTVYLGG